MIAIKNVTHGPAFVLASILSAYPDDTFFENVNLLLEDKSLEKQTDGSLKEHLEKLRSSLDLISKAEGGIDELRSEYIDLFDRGRQVNSLYETEYGRERAMVKGNELVDISGFYRAFGFETGAEDVRAEMVDHVAVELEFYALLVLKSELLTQSSDADGEEIVLDARRKFLKSHLGRFVSAICERPGVMESSFYLAVFQFCRDLIQGECERLNVTVEKEHWISPQAETADISCGGSVGCLK